MVSFLNTNIVRFGGLVRFCTVPFDEAGGINSKEILKFILFLFSKRLNDPNFAKECF